MPKSPTPTGKILFRLDPELHERLIRVSRRVGVQALLRGYVLRLVEHLEKKGK